MEDWGDIDHSTQRAGYLKTALSGPLQTDFVIWSGWTLLQFALRRHLLFTDRLCPNLGAPLSRRATRIMASMALSIACIAAGGAAARETPSQMEYDVKAAFIYNFVRVTKWPKCALGSDAKKLVIGVLGKSPIRSALRPYQAAELKDRKLDIRHFDKPEEIKDCHVLYVAASQQEEVEKTLKKLKGSSTLTMGEFDGFAQGGGIVNFYKVKKQVRHEANIRFEINLDAMKRAGLKISTGVLDLAKLVRDAKPKEP